MLTKAKMAFKPSDIVIPIATQQIDPNMGKDDANKTRDVDRCYTYIGKCSGGGTAPCGPGGKCSAGGKECTQGSANDVQYQNISSCGSHKDNPHCTRVCDDTCPEIGGFVPDINDRSFTPQFAGRWSGMDPVLANCPYPLSSIKTEEDVNKWRDSFSNSIQQNATIFDQKVIPYYCALGDNMIAGEGANGSQGACQTYCEGQWKTNTSCNHALQTFCAKGDNAINNDVCYDACKTTNTDDRPTWCDPLIVSACALADTSAASSQNESFVGMRGCPLFFIILGLLAYFLYRKFK